MIGDCGTSKTGEVYNYYSCAKHKKKNACKKRNERKGFVERIAVQRAMNYIFEDDNVENIAERVYALFKSETDVAQIKSLEQKIASTKREIDKIVSAFIDATLKTVRAQLEEQAARLENTISELEKDLEAAKAAGRIAITKESIVAWINLFKDSDITDEIEQKRIIDTFINSIYVFDDHFLIYFNIDDKKLVTYDEAQADYSGSNQTLKSSDTTSTAPPPKRVVSEPLMLIIKSGKFGIILPKKDFN